MKFLFLSSLGLFVLFSCFPKKKLDIISFRKGHFKSILENKTDSSTFYRDEKLQIESYKGKTDTFSIFWKSNFEYKLCKLFPKNKLDSIPFIVKMTSVREDHYKFKANFLGNKFRQEGVIYKIDKKE